MLYSLGGKNIIVIIIVKAFNSLVYRGFTS
jgi:hypothetical protein